MVPFCASSVVDSTTLYTDLLSSQDPFTLKLSCAV